MKPLMSHLCLFAFVFCLSAARAENSVPPEDLESIGAFLKDAADARSVQLSAFAKKRNLQAETLTLFAEAYQKAAAGRKTRFESGLLRAETIGTLADARSSLAGAVLSYSEAQKNQAETVATLADARLTEAKRGLVLAEIQRLWLQTKITGYEFRRVVQGDTRLREETDRLEQDLTIVKDLVWGTANWKTWMAVDRLLKETSALDKIHDVMFATQVPPLPYRDNFVANDGDTMPMDFPGGSLGKLVRFSRKQNFSFDQYGDAHEHVMKVVVFINAGTRMTIERLRQINESLRLTIANL